VTTATADHVSNHLRELIEGIGLDNLEHIVAAMREQGRVPDSLALELANELAEIVSAPPMDTDLGRIYNRPTVGWYRRKARRLEAAR
jgi:hypothetical protein